MRPLATSHRLCSEERANNPRRAGASALTVQTSTEREVAGAARVAAEELGPAGKKDPTLSSIAITAQVAAGRAALQGGVVKAR